GPQRDHPRRAVRRVLRAAPDSRHGRAVGRDPVARLRGSGADGPGGGGGGGVWIAYEVVGSYEEMPPNLIDELSRDRRWCQGNLMNARLMLTRGLHPAHRVVFLTGVMAYLSAPLGFLFLVLSTVQLALHTLVPPEYFTQPCRRCPRPSRLRTSCCG